MEGETLKLTPSQFNEIRKINSSATACQDGFQTACMAFANRQQVLILKREDFFKEVAITMGTTLQELQEKGLGITIKDGMAAITKLSTAPKPQEVKK